MPVARREQSLPELRNNEFANKNFFKESHDIIPDAAEKSQLIQTETNQANYESWKSLDLENADWFTFDVESAPQDQSSSSAEEKI